ncbi:hypothetical protein HNP86_001842 [Methanococcus maripaludis]|uniref:Uncharacterized protein n=1 Tax=Methanococcus maripaludis TaxID=39152 RepID=A0A7J9NXE1_METMI|nr:hypothetical protein [Methanococcus maripaludis]MBA2851683.1 hypothetical protein [Methanococcus maripaludis]
MMIPILLDGISYVVDTDTYRVRFVMIDDDFQDIPVYKSDFIKSAFKEYCNVKHAIKASTFSYEGVEYGVGTVGSRHIILCVNDSLLEDAIKDFEIKSVNDDEVMLTKVFDIIERFSFNIPIASDSLLDYVKCVKRSVVANNTKWSNSLKQDPAWVLWRYMKETGVIDD